MLERAVVDEGVDRTGGVILNPGDLVENVLVHIRRQRPLTVTMYTVEIPTPVAITDFVEAEGKTSDGRACTFYGVGVTSDYLKDVFRRVTASRRGSAVVQGDQQDESLAIQASVAARTGIVAGNSAIADVVDRAGISRTSVTAVYFSIPTSGPPFRE